MKEVNVVPLIFLNLFKASGLKCFDEENEEIRKTLSVYIGSFMKIRGYREWSGLLSYLSTRLNLDDIQSIRNTFQFFSIVVKESDIEFLSIDDNV